METKQAEYRSDLAALMKEIADRNAESADRIAAMTDRIAEAADRSATATERMASSRWWQTAIMIAVVALVGAVVTGLPVLPEIVSRLADG